VDFLTSLLPAWDPWYILFALLVVAMAGPFLAAVLVPDFYWLGYGVVGRNIHVRLFHVLPIWFIPISNVQSIECSREGVVPGNPITWLWWFEITRPYVLITLKRGLFWNLWRQLQITPFFADRFVARVRSQMNGPASKQASWPGTRSRS
jgi:hypothetical protein